MLVLVNVLIMVQVLNSDDFFLLLSNWTGLKLHPQFEGDSDEDDEDEEKREPLGGASRVSVRRWKKVLIARKHKRIQIFVTFVYRGRFLKSARLAKLPNLTSRVRFFSQSKDRRINELMFYYILRD